MSLPLLLDVSPYLSVLSRDSAGGDAQVHASNVSTLYHLSGVIAHAGTASKGHYVFFGRECFANSTGCPPRRDDSWYKYDDESVTKVSFLELCQQCFGGRASLCPALHPDRNDNIGQIGNVRNVMSVESGPPGTAYVVMYSAAGDRECGGAR